MHQLTIDRHARIAAEICALQDTARDEAAQAREDMPWSTRRTINHQKNVAACHARAAMLMDQLLHGHPHFAEEFRAQFDAIDGRLPADVITGTDATTMSPANWAPSTADIQAAMQAGMDAANHQLGDLFVGAFGEAEKLGYGAGSWQRSAFTTGYMINLQRPIWTDPETGKLVRYGALGEPLTPAARRA